MRRRPHHVTCPPARERQVAPQARGPLETLRNERDYHYRQKLELEALKTLFLSASISDTRVRSFLPKAVSLHVTAFPAAPELLDGTRG